MNKSILKFIKDNKNRYGYSKDEQYASYIFELGLLQEKINLKNKFRELRKYVKKILSKRTK